MTKIAIFASGNGSNFEAIINYFKNTDIEFICVSDKKDAFVLKRAEKLGIKSFIIPFEKNINFLENNKFDLVILAGYMRILPKEVLELSTFINIHPSILPKYKGINAIKRAYEAKEKITGITIHYVSENVDEGEIIAQETINIDNLTLDKLEEEIHKLEHSLLPKTIEKLIKKYNVLIVGSGAREHALAYKISQSKFLNKLYLYQANDGFKHLGENINAMNYDELAKLAKEKQIDLMIVGPELPLCEGIVDIFTKEGIDCIGPNKYWSQLEGSKSFAKEFMKRNNIPTAEYKIIEKYEEQNKFPIAIKANGLCAGKGVVIAYNKETATKTIKEFLNGKFNEASKKILIEEYLEGEEFSLICYWDGQKLIPFPIAKDYKKLYNSKEAPNTGGMGAICPVKTNKKSIKKYIQILQEALRKEKANFKGIIYSGLINTKDGLKVLEFNMRFGDPETQAIMMNIESDLLETFIFNKQEIKSKKKQTKCIVLASEGYPQKPNINDEITIKDTNDVQIFYAGVKNVKNKLYTNSGRVLSIVGNDNNKIFQAINNISYKNKIYRKDIIEN